MCGNILNNFGFDFGTFAVANRQHNDFLENTDESSEQPSWHSVGLYLNRELQRHEQMFPSPILVKFHLWRCQQIPHHTMIMQNTTLFSNIMTTRIIMTMRMMKCMLGTGWITIVMSAFRPTTENHQIIQNNTDGDGDHDIPFFWDDDFATENRNWNETLYKDLRSCYVLYLVETFG